MGSPVYNPNHLQESLDKLTSAYQRPRSPVVPSVPVPTVSAIDPPLGPTSGGTSVTITGTNFTGATSVTIGGTSCTSFAVVNDTTITCVTPATSAGPFDVVVIAPSGNGTLASGFRAIANMRLWLRADRGITTVGGNVSAWNDISGVGDPNQNLSQSNASLRPQLTANKSTYNNRPVVDFGVAHADGELLSSGIWASPVAQPITRFLVGNTPNGGTNNYMMDARPGQALQAALLGTHGTTSTQVFDGVGLSSGAEPLTPTVFCVNDNGATTKLFRNAITAETTGNAGTNGVDGVTVGNYLGGGSFSCKGPIAEVMLFSGTLSLSDRTAVMNYLGARYGITIGP